MGSLKAQNPTTLIKSSGGYEASNLIRGIAMLSMTLPLFVLSVFFYHPQIRSWYALLAGIGFFTLALFVGHRSLMPIWKKGQVLLGSRWMFIEIILAMSAFFCVVVGTGIRGGVLLLLPAIPFLLTPLVGDLRLMLFGWVLLVAGLAVTTGLQVPALDATWITILIAGVFGSIAMMVHVDLSGVVREADLKHALAQIAARTGTMRNWPGDLCDIAPQLALALDVERFCILTRVSQGLPFMEAFAWPYPGWPSKRELGDLAQLCLQADGVVVANGLCAASAILEDISVVVVAPDQSQHKVLIDQSIEKTIALLLVTMFDRSRLIENLMHQANTDELTRLANRRHLMEVLEYECSRHSRNGLPLTIAMLDIDYFKEFNDRFGHPVGDCLLRDLADGVVGRIRRQDVFARYGGEEFCLVLPETDTSSAIELLDSIRTAHMVKSPDGRDVTFSAGIATWDGDESIMVLINRADQGLYLAKRSGRNQVIAALQTFPHIDRA